MTYLWVTVKLMLLLLVAEMTLSSYRVALIGWEIQLFLMLRAVVVVRVVVAWC